jgi:hypothetical protein
MDSTSTLGNGGQKGSNSTVAIVRNQDLAANDPEQTRGGMSELGNLIKVFHDAEQA